MFSDTGAAGGGYTRSSPVRPAGTAGTAGRVRGGVPNGPSPNPPGAAAGNARAFAQATWRHLLFGVVLGELERRLNPPPEPEPEPYSDAMSSNGHGDLDHAIGVARP